MNPIQAIRHVSAALLTAALLTAGLATPALAEDGASVVAKLDSALSRATDHQLDFEIVHQNKGKDPKKMRMEVKVKGELRLTEFTSPPDMKGTRALVRSRTQMYVYLPAYKKVRRIATHQVEGFLGTTFSNEDMSTSEYGSIWVPKLLSEDAKVWKLELTLKDGAKSSYSKLNMDVLKKEHHPAKIMFFDDKDAHMKTEVRTKYRCEGDICVAGEHKMTDHTRGDVWTKFILSNWKVNTGLSDSLFSVRRLQK